MSTNAPALSKVERPPPSESEKDPNYTPKAAAAFLGLSISTLERHRSQGTGPTFSKCGPGKRAPVRYKKSALLAWLAEFEFSSTSQYRRK